MMFGNHVLSVKKGELVFSPQPSLPAYLIPEDGRVCATLFGNIEVIYQFADVMNYIPGRYEIKTMKFTYQNGSVANVSGEYVLKSTSLQSNSCLILASKFMLWSIVRPHEYL